MYQEETDVSTVAEAMTGCHLNDTSRRVAHHKHDNDDYHHQGYVVFIRQAARCHSPSAALRMPEGDDDARVQIGKQTERNEEGDNLVEYVVIHELVGGAGSDECPRPASSAVINVTLEEAWYIVER